MEFLHRESHQHDEIIRASNATARDWEGSTEVGAVEVAYDLLGGSGLGGTWGGKWSRRPQPIRSAIHFDLKLLVDVR